MRDRALEEFSKKLVSEVRDVSIKSCDAEISEQAGSPIAKRWRDALESGDCKRVLDVAIPDIVDDVIFHFLNAIDQNFLHLIYLSEMGDTIDLVDDGFGELGGSYMGFEGWRYELTNERTYDDFSDLI